MSNGQARELDGRPFEPGDQVTRNFGEWATVTYVSDTHDYAEMQYAPSADGYVHHFRTRKSEWRKPEIIEGRSCVYVDEPNHSKGLLTVFHGRAEPTFICGYHEQKFGVPTNQEG